MMKTERVNRMIKCIFKIQHIIIAITTYKVKNLFINILSK